MREVSSVLATLWLANGLLWASGAASSPDATLATSEVIKLAFAYGGFAVMALLMWFMLREQQQQAARQLDAAAERFIKALESERAERGRDAEAIVKAIDINHREAMQRLSALRDVLRGVQGD